MTLAQFKFHLKNSKNLSFKLPNGTNVPGNFHLTEVAKINRNFIDCGGTIRKEEAVSCQLWCANDLNHKLAADKLLTIINLAEKKLPIEKDTIKVEVEYQGENTIQRFALGYDGTTFLLKPQYTDCLAQDTCGAPQDHSIESSNSSCCTSDKTNCC